jgi:hypothetical protein
MPEGEMPNVLESEIAQIERDLASKREALEQQKQSGAIVEVPHEKEILKEVVGEKINLDQQVIQSQDQAPPVSPIIPPPSIQSPSYLSDELKDKIQELVGIAFSKSINEAIGIAKKTGNAALIDAFHDALVDELYNHLVERGKLKRYNQNYKF